MMFSRRGDFDIGGRSSGEIWESGTGPSVDVDLSARAIVILAIFSSEVVDPPKHPRFGR